jgi:NitT/TauT family transport system substrate-binding protein
MEYVNSHSSEDIAKVIAPQFPDTDADTIAVIVERYKSQDTWKNDLVFSKDSFTLLQDILYEAGVIKEYAPYSDLVDTGFAQKALK